MKKKIVVMSLCLLFVGCVNTKKNKKQINELKSTIAQQQDIINGQKEIIKNLEDNPIVIEKEKEVIKTINSVEYVQPVRSQQVIHDDKLEFENIPFEFDKYSVSPKAIPIINESINTLKDNMMTTVLIEGRADERGTEEYNYALGLARAEQVKQVLVKNGIRAGRLKTISLGFSEPICRGKSDQCYDKNRVVCIREISFK
jgi:outer membrane protein OmpA-like peptidoglycan-associated protein